MEKERSSEETKKLVEDTQDTLMDIFEINDIPVPVALEAMLKMVFSLLKLSNTSIEDVKKLFDYLVIAYKEEK